ncbi:hypothetical protein GCM10010160_74720 [Acrocarpospora corrugata]
MLRSRPFPDPSPGPDALRQAEAHDQLAALAEPAGLDSDTDVSRPVLPGVGGRVTQAFASFAPTDLGMPGTRTSGTQT